MKTTLDCRAASGSLSRDEDDLVEKVQEHLAERHPDRDYTRDEILFLAF
jgi:hypothetical protein